MARIAGVNNPQNKVVHVALTYIHGIGNKYSKDICKKLNISENTIGFKIDIATNATVSLDVHESGSDTLEAKKMGVEPFGVKFQTKTRRARGAWR